MPILLTALRASAIQLGGILGIFFLCGFILSVLSAATHRQYRRSIGWKGILWTAWIGTPIHELGHVFFAFLFGHKIHSVAFFRPNESTGGLGHVDHSYQRYHLYQRIGNFFIGSAPLIFGALTLTTLLYILVPNAKDVFLPLTNPFSTSLWQSGVESAIAVLKLFSFSNVRTWQFWLFLYLSFCIVSHMAPSKKDRVSMYDGFFFLIILVLIGNIITLHLGVDVTSYMLRTVHYTSIFIAMFIYAIALSLMHYVAITSIFTPFRRS